MWIIYHIFFYCVYLKSHWNTTPVHKNNSLRTLNALQRNFHLMETFDISNSLHKKYTRQGQLWIGLSQKLPFKGVLEEDRQKDSKKKNKKTTANTLQVCLLHGKVVHFTEKMSQDLTLWMRGLISSSAREKKSLIKRKTAKTETQVRGKRG